jgi:hypothetical protein
MSQENVELTRAYFEEIARASRDDFDTEAPQGAAGATRTTSPTACSRRSWSPAAATPPT